MVVSYVLLWFESVNKRLITKVELILIECRDIHKKSHDLKILRDLRLEKSQVKPI